MTLAELQRFVATEIAGGTAMDSEIELLVVDDFGCAWWADVAQASIAGASTLVAELAQYVPGSAGDQLVEATRAALGACANDSARP